MNTSSINYRFKGRTFVEPTYVEDIYFNRVFYHRLSAGAMRFIACSLASIRVRGEKSAVSSLEVNYGSTTPDYN